MQSERRPQGPVERRHRDHVLLPHGAQHVVAPLLREHGVPERVVVARRLWQSGEHRSLRQRQLLCVLVEVRLRGRLGAVRVAPVEHRVQVHGEDLGLRPAVLRLDREPGLVELALDRLAPRAVRDVEVADELLRDRRAALRVVPVRDVAPEGASDALVVEGAVLPVALVLDRDGGVPQVRAQVLPAEWGAVLVRRNHGQAIVA